MSCGRSPVFTLQRHRSSWWAAKTGVGREAVERQREVGGERSEVQEVTTPLIYWEINADEGGVTIPITVVVLHRPAA